MRARISTAMMAVSVAAGTACLAVSPAVAGAAPAALAAPCAYGTPDGGYLAATENGQVFTFGTAVDRGSLAGRGITRPITAVAATPGGLGYWLAGTDGGVFSFGDARFHGSTGAIHLSRPVVGMASTPDGGGYWLVAADGGIFAFGDARFRGSTGGMHLSKPVVGMAATPDGKGYWLVGADGGVFAFGDARFRGSTGGLHLSETVVAIAATADGAGYWLVAADGGVFAFGDARFRGSAAGAHLAGRVVGIAVTPDGHGYTLVDAGGGTYPFGTATYQGTFAGGLSGNPVAAVAAVPGTPPATGQPEFQAMGPVHYPYGDYYYAGGSQEVDAAGASVQICQAAPDIGSLWSNRSVGHSLTEMAISGPTPGDYVEFGSTSMQPDATPELFATWWLAGTFEGSSGFVQLSNAITNWMYLPVGSTASYAMVQAAGSWDYYYDGQLIGYFPDSLWSGTFTTAAEVQVFGEVETPAGPPYGQMGDGLFGHQAGAAMVNGYELMGSATPAAFTDVYDTETTPADYDVQPLSATSFRYGGPGAS